MLGKSPQPEFVMLLFSFLLSLIHSLLIKYMSIVKNFNQPYIVSIKYISIVKETNFDNLTRNAPAEKYDRNVHMNLKKISSINSRDRNLKEREKRARPRMLITTSRKKVAQVSKSYSSPKKKCNV